MLIARKILAAGAMVLCAGVLLFCLAGAIGVWIARAPLTGAAVALLTTAYETLQKIESAAGQVSQGLGELHGLAVTVDDAVGDVSAGAGLLKQIGPIGDALDAIGAGTGQMEGRLAELGSSAGEIESQAGGLASKAELLRRRIPAWISMGAVALTLALLWIGLGQVSLFFHALAWFRRAPTETAVQPAAAGPPDASGEPEPRLDLPPPDASS
jgi:hypothetical protein